MRFQVNGLDGNVVLAAQPPAIGSFTFEGEQFDFGTGVDGEPIIASFFDQSAILGPDDSQPHGTTNMTPEPSSHMLFLVAVLLISSVVRRRF